MHVIALFSGVFPYKKYTEVIFSVKSSLEFSIDFHITSHFMFKKNPLTIIVYMKVYASHFVFMLLVYPEKNIASRLLFY